MNFTVKLQNFSPEAAQWAPAWGAGGQWYTLPSAILTAFPENLAYTFSNVAPGPGSLEITLYSQQGFFLTSLAFPNLNPPDGGTLVVDAVEQKVSLETRFPSKALALGAGLLAAIILVAKKKAGRG